MCVSEAEENGKKVMLCAMEWGNKSWKQDSVSCLSPLTQCVLACLFPKEIHLSNTARSNKVRIIRLKKSFASPTNKNLGGLYYLEGFVQENSRSKTPHPDFSDCRLNADWALSNRCSIFCLFTFFDKPR